MSAEDGTNKREPFDFGDDIEAILGRMDPPKDGIAYEYDEVADFVDAAYGDLPLNARDKITREILAHDPHCENGEDESHEEKAAFQLAFNVTEAPNEGTEAMPVLYYEHNGFVFKVELDLNQNAYRVQIDTKRRESFDRDWQVLLPEAEKQAKEELRKRRIDTGRSET